MQVYLAQYRSVRLYNQTKRRGVRSALQAGQWPFLFREFPHAVHGLLNRVRRGQRLFHRICSHDSLRIDHSCERERKKRQKLGRAHAMGSDPRPKKRTTTKMTPIISDQVVN